MTNIVNSDSIVHMEDDSKSSVLGGFMQVNLMLKLLIPSLFLATLVAVIVYILFKREEESTQL